MQMIFDIIFYWKNIGKITKEIFSKKKC
jgi:hypothetical protein